MNKLDIEEKLLAFIFVLRSDPKRFTGLMQDLLKDDIQGVDNCSKSRAQAFELLQDVEANGLVYVTPRNNQMRKFVILIPTEARVMTQLPE